MVILGMEGLSIVGHSPTKTQSYPLELGPKVTIKY